MSEFCGSIIDNRSHVTIRVLKGKYRNSKYELNDVLRKFLEGICNVKFFFKVSTDDIS